jgi:hypothetical protein
MPNLTELCASLTTTGRIIVKCLERELIGIFIQARQKPLRHI